MKRTSNIWTKQSLSTIMILLMMMLGGSVNAWGQEEEKEIYSTDFTNWKSVDRKKATNVIVELKTLYSNEDFTFTLNGVGISPADTKFAGHTGFMQTAKYTSEYSTAEPSAVTSALASITKITLHQAATGGKRGIKVSVKGDGDADWVVLHNKSIATAAGEDLEIEVNRTNCQIKFESFTLAQNAFITDLAIYGKVKAAANVNVSYYNTDGSLIGTETVEGNSQLKYKYGADDVTVGAGEVFRGWFNGADNLATKITEGTTLISDISLYAKATPKEEATFGSKYTYDMTKNNWYAEDHDLIDITGGAFHDNQHGWAMGKGGSIKLQVASKAKIEFTLCQYNNNDDIIVTDADGNQLGTIASKAATDGEVHSFSYDGIPTTLTFSFSSTTYIHSIKQYNYKPVYISFNFPNNKIEGTCPETIQADYNGNVNLPTNGLFYREGWTFQYWTDGTNVYQPGAHIFNESVTLYPKMAENTLLLTDANTPVIVTWPFDHTKAPAINMNQSAESMGYTQVGTLEGSPYDVRLWMDTKTGIGEEKGKITNQDNDVNSLPGEGGQFNNGTKFTLPAVYGMTLTIHASDKTTTGIETSFGEGSNTKLTVTDANGFTVADEDIKIIDNKTLQFTYKGDATEITLNVIQACNNTSKKYGFYKDITATYPVLPTINCVKELTNPDTTNFPDEKIDNVGSVTVTLKDPEAVSHNNTGKRYKVGDVLFIEAKSSYGYELTEIKDKNNSTTASTYEYTVSEGTNDIVVSFTRQPMYKLVVKTTDQELGTVSMTPKYDNFYKETRSSDDKMVQVESWYTEGTEVKVAGEAIINYMLDYWTDQEEGTNLISNSNPYTFKMGAANQNLFAYFTLGNIGTVIFKVPDGAVNGEATADNYKGAYSITPDELRNVRSFAIPTCYTLYKNMDDKGKGSTLDHWTEEDGDGSNRYEPGQVYSFRKANETITLVPVFVGNPTTSDNRLNNTVIRYDFGRSIRDYDDPSMNQRRKVCGQAVNIGKNEKPFWTTQAYIETMEEGQVKPHTRDAAIWCDTGDDGYIRNEDLDDWCAFGPGTTLWVPSGVGTKVTMLTYSKISTTTIDGKIPTLDEQRTAEERNKQGSEKVFVYSYTTQSTENRIPIVIGDDYSYYQWIEVSILSANLVNLHTVVNNELRGTLISTESTAGNEMKELEDGGYSFHQGDRVKLSFKRLFGYEFDKIVDIDKTDATGNPLAVLQMREDGKVDMVGLNNVSTVSTVDQNADGSWGVATGDDKTVFVLRQVEPTDEEEAEGERTRYEVEFDITTHRNLRIYFKEKPTYYITYNGGDFASGTPPEVAWVEEGDKFIIPRNTTLYYDGNTLDHWVDEDANIYKIGGEYTAKAIDMRLFPVFVPNPFNVLDLQSDATATWYLDKNDGAPTINYEKTEGILVTQLTNADGQSIDMKVNLNGKNGKLNNADANRPERIQINGGSIVEFPSTPNCVVTWVATSDFTKMTIAGKEVTTTDKQKRQVEAVCSGDSAYQKIEFTEGVYSRYFSVTYKPQTAKKATIESLTCDGVTLNADEISQQMKANGYVTFTVAPWKSTNEAMPTVTGTATEGGTVKATEATLLNKECAVTVRTAAGIIVETYPIHFEFETPEEGNNPVYESVTVNGKTYTNTSNEIDDVPQSGTIVVRFNRTMAATNIRLEDPTIESSSSASKELSFRYWDLPKGATIPLVFTPADNIFKDIYGKTCQQTLSITLHVTEATDRNHHHTFDFIVGKDGTIDEAIEAANNNTKTDNHRYFIFVPDGEYELTGNETLKFAIGKDEDAPKDEKGKPRPDMNGQNNHLTTVKKANISLIGQSKYGTIIYNHPVVEGISYTATIHLGKDAKDFYAEDLTLENRFNYWGSMETQGSGGAGRAAAFHDQGNRTIMKNVVLDSWQDTYYSANASADYRGYFENSDILGVVDFLCGNGDIWLQKCNIILRDRTGNNVAAPSTEVGQQWGYVFNECNIKSETDNPTLFKGNDWTLARPWNGSPAITYLNCMMYTQPRSYGWNRMNTDLTLRFHEYRSMDESGNQLSLGTRSLASCSPAPGSDDCILSDAQAEKYTVRNAMGGNDAFEPNELCKQIDAASAATEDLDENHIVWNDNITLDDDNLTWQAQEEALCYFVFKLDDNGKWIYQTNTTEANVNLTVYGSGYYCVRAANQRGGLGAATKRILFTVTDPYELDLKQLGDLTDEDGNPCGWSTICLPFNAKVPTELKVYAATAHYATDAETQITDYTMTLTPVEVIDGEKGYVVYGPAGKHYFKLTSRSCAKETILTGNATENAISTTNKPGYVLANKSWGLGFYKFSGSNYAAYKAWLPQSMVGEEVQDGLATSARCIRLLLSDGTTAIRLPSLGEEAHGEYYNLSGQRLPTPSAPGIYIERGKGKVVKK